MPSLSSFIKLVRLFWNNADQIAKLLDALVSKLPDAGTAMVNAGNVNIAIAQLIKQGDSTPLNTNAQMAVSNVLAAMDAVGQVVTGVSTKLTRIQNDINQISVPVLTIEDKKFDIIGTIPVITGHSDVRLLNPAALVVGEASTALGDLFIQFTMAHDSLSGLWTTLGQMGDDMTDSGNALVTVGQIFQQMH